MISRIGHTQLWRPGRQCVATTTAVAVVATATAVASHPNSTASCIDNDNETCTLPYDICRTRDVLVINSYSCSAATQHHKNALYIFLLANLGNVSVFVKNLPCIGEKLDAQQLIGTDSKTIRKCQRYSSPQLWSLSISLLSVRCELLSTIPIMYLHQLVCLRMQTDHIPPHWSARDWI